MSENHFAARVVRAEPVKIPTTCAEENNEKGLPSAGGDKPWVVSGVPGGSAQALVPLGHLCSVCVLAKAAHAHVLACAARIAAPVKQVQAVAHD